MDLGEVCEGVLYESWFNSTTFAIYETKDGCDAFSRSKVGGGGEAKDLSS